MGSEDMEQFEQGKGEKVEEGKEELNEEKRKMPGLVGEVDIPSHHQYPNVCQHQQVYRLVGE